MDKDYRMMLIEKLAKRIKFDTILDRERQGFTAESLLNPNVYIRDGKKYTKVDLDGSGKYMVDGDGNIYGIKAYGQIHKGHYYGTLETIEDYFWGGYVAVKFDR